MSLEKNTNLFISGKLADRVYYTRDKVLRDRAYVIPVQPGTPIQLARWALFRAGVRYWQGLNQTEKDDLDKDAYRLQYTGFNLFMSRWMRGEITMLKSIYRGNVLLGAGQHNITIPTIDPDRSFLNYNCTVASGANLTNAVWGCHWARIENATTVRVAIIQIGTTAQFNFHWEVVEYF